MISVITEEKYALKLAAAIARFEKKIELAYPRGKLGCVYRLVRDSGTSTTYREAALLTPDHYDPFWHASSRLALLEGRGFIRRIGFVDRGYFTDAPHRRAPMFRASENPPPSVEFHAESARKALYKTLDQLEGRRQRVSCVARRFIETDTYAFDERYHDMTARRAQGETLLDIAQDYGITRERVRQIVNKTLKIDRPKKRKAIRGLIWGLCII